MTTYLMKTLKTAFLGAVFACTAALAQAQTVELGSKINLKLGKDVQAAHASEGKLSLDNGNVQASGAVADGARVGDSKFESSVHGAVAAPAAFVAGMLAN